MAADDAHQRLLSRLSEMAETLLQLDRLLEDPEVATDHRRTRDLSIRRAAIAPLCARYNRYSQIVGEIEDYRQTIRESAGDDPDYIMLVREELPALEREAARILEQIKNKLVTSDDRAVGSVILELRAGVGGDEAALWVGDLLDIYSKYAASRGWKFDELSLVPGDAGGFRSAVLNVSGQAVWAELGYEGGTHQVKRVPATESQGRIHTSTATVAVLPEPEEIELELDESDVQVHITTSQGPGGQNVNKVATAVHLIHTPTGVEVRMQYSKSQQQNREKAWKLLRARLFERQRSEAERQRAEQRVQMIGSGGRAEKIRTYRFKDNLVVDHRLRQSFNLSEIRAGQLNPLIRALIEMDTARRLAAL